MLLLHLALVNSIRKWRLRVKGVINTNQQRDHQQGYPDILAGTALGVALMDSGWDILDGYYSMSAGNSVSSVLGNAHNSDIVF